MKRIVARRPSPAMIVALIALLASLGGVSYGLSKGSVDSRDIATNGVRTQDVRNNDLRGKDVRNETLTGADLAESSLGKVPTAAAADTATSAGSAATAATAGSADTARAVRGVVVERVSFRAPDGTGPTPIYSAGGLVLTANCTPADDVNVIATTSTDASLLYSYSNDTLTATGEFDNTINDGEFDSGESYDLVVEDDSDQVGHTRYATKGGSTVTLEWVAEDDLGGSLSGGDECVFTGHAMQSG